MSRKSVNVIFSLEYFKTVFDFFLLWRTDSADGGVWMNIRCISTMQSGNSMRGPPEDAGKGIVRIKGNVEHSRTRDLRA